MNENKFHLVSKYKPSGDQPRAIKELVDGIERGDEHQVLLGVTGSGKTFTMSNVIQQTQKPTLIITPNKTLAAQLYSEFKSFFPHNRVEYFISYYDYYQPEAYIPKTDVYIEKDLQINDEIDRLRLRATNALVEDRRDVIVVASVSCIYSIGAKQDFKDLLFGIHVGMQISRKALIFRLSDLYFERNDVEMKRGSYRVRGDVIDILPASETREGLRIEMFGDEIEAIKFINPVTGEVLGQETATTIYPAKLFVTSQSQVDRAMGDIKDELYERTRWFRAYDKPQEAQRLEQRTLFDLEMMKEVGYCSGIENYSMHLSGRQVGDTPNTIMTYFPKDFLLIVDESHITMPQVRGMFNGDRARKKNLVEHGFRLPSALENRPLQFDEFEKLSNQAIYMSATPGDYEMEKAEGVVVEQVIRPTGLLDPEISVRPVGNQIDDLYGEIRKRVKIKERVLVTTLTKRMSEDLTDYLQDLGVRVAYIHSEVDALARVEIIRGLRLGDTDVLVGVNLLREGLDMPEVSLVAILDADKEGFLRSERSLMQTAGRTARNDKGLVILYADRITKSMKVLISETKRRREIQMAYNKEHGIDPKTVYKTHAEILEATSVADIQAKRLDDLGDRDNKKESGLSERIAKNMSAEQKRQLLDQMFDDMKDAARDLEFERAGEIRDEIEKIKAELNAIAGK
jgi:excinuclease ABC subunit B